MVLAALRGSTNDLQSPALERRVNLALSKIWSNSRGPLCLIWSFYKAVVLLNNSVGVVIVVVVGAEELKTQLMTLMVFRATAKMAIWCW